jgi:hypothetical protein
VRVQAGRGGPVQQAHQATPATPGRGEASGPGLGVGDSRAQELRGHGPGEPEAHHGLHKGAARQSSRLDVSDPVTQGLCVHTYLLWESVTLALLCLFDNGARTGKRWSRAQCMRKEPLRQAAREARSPQPSTTACWGDAALPSVRSCPSSCRWAYPLIWCF